MTYIDPDLGATPMAFAFELGDVVTLNSGGPAMTVLERYDNGNFLVVWIAPGAAGFCQLVVPPQAIKKQGALH